MAGVVAAAVLAGAALGLYGDCSECETCVAACGPRCLRKAFGTDNALPYDVPTAVERCCWDHDNRTGTDHDCYGFDPISESSLPKTCRETHSLWREALKYWQCRRSCDARYTEDPRNFMQECCYETAVKACGDLLSSEGVIEDENADLFEDCKRLTFVHAGCPGGGGLYDYNLSSLEVEVKWSLAQLYSVDDPHWKTLSNCDDAASKGQRDCWNEQGSDERRKLTVSVRDPSSPEVKRMYELLIHWAREYQRYRGQGSWNYARRFVERHGRWNFFKDEAFDNAFLKGNWETLPMRGLAAKDEL